MSETPSTPAGWYPDPNTGEQRYWDGQAWTEHTLPQQPVQPQEPVSPYAAPQPPQGYAAPQYTGQSYDPAQYAGAQSTGNTLSIIGIVCGCIALIFCPPGFGIAGIVLGIIGKNKGERLGTTAIIVSIVGLVLGIILSLVVLSAMRS